MKKALRFLPLFLLLALLTPSCKRKEYTGKLRIVFKPVVHGAALNTNGAVYNDPPQFTRFNVGILLFYMSNLKLIKNDNSTLSFNDADHVGLLHAAQKPILYIASHYRLVLTKVSLLTLD
jgi:uncharacterized protein YhhL (DUF1145 family)